MKTTKIVYQQNLSLRPTVLIAEPFLLTKLAEYSVCFVKAFDVFIGKFHNGALALAVSNSIEGFVMVQFDERGHCVELVLRCAGRGSCDISLAAFLRIQAVSQALNWRHLYTKFPGLGVQATQFFTNCQTSETFA